MNPAVLFVHEQLTGTKEFPKFKPGDNITVNYKIIEGTKERIQSFKGDVLKKQGEGATATFTVRKISDGVGVERIFPYFSPNIESIEVNKAGRVRRAKLFYQRKRSGKSARIKDHRTMHDNAHVGLMRRNKHDHKLIASLTHTRDFSHGLKTSCLDHGVHLS